MRILESILILANIKKLMVYLNIIKIFNNFILTIINELESPLPNSFSFLICPSNDLFLNIFVTNISIFWGINSRDYILKLFKKYNYLFKLKLNYFNNNIFMLIFFKDSVKVFNLR